MIYQCRLAERRGLLGGGRPLSVVQEAAVMVLMHNDAYLAAQQARALSGDEGEVSIEHFDEGRYDPDEVEYVPRNDLTPEQIRAIVGQISTQITDQPTQDGTRP